MTSQPSQPLPSDIPAEALSYLQEMGWLDADRLQIGDSAPDAPLLFVPEGAAPQLSDCRPARLKELWTTQPAVLIFGSYT